MSEGEVPCPHLWIQPNGLCVCGQPPRPKHEHRLAKDSAGQHVCMDCHQIVFVPPDPVVVVEHDDEMFPLPVTELMIRMYWASYDGDYEFDVPISWYVDTIAKYLEAQGLPDTVDIWASLADRVDA